MAKKLTQAKARKILHDKTVHGKPLTEKQRKFFGAVSSGAIPQAQVGTMLAPITGEDVANFFDLFSVPQKALTKLISGKYQTPSEAMNIKNPVGAFATDMILDPVNLMGAGVAARQAIKFKPKPGMMYRGLGEEGYKDAIESGVFRPKQHGYAESRSLAEKVTTPKQFGSTFYAPADNFSVVKNYGGKYVAEVPFDEATFARRYGRKDWSWSTRKQIPINEGRILQKDWLRGYKEVKKPKKKAQNGIEGTMGGLTDVGFNYNGAWGGTMQMGGSIPGAVGFTYARTVGAAPANGPYAKKTKASAQDGKEMSFYQHGLDWKPRNISQDGSIISPLGQWAYPGEITTVPSNEITMQGVPYPVLGISDMGDTQMMYPGEDYTFDGDYVTEYPMAKGGISVNEADAQPLKKLDQLLNFTNYNDMAKAKKGKKLPKAQDGLSELNTQLGSMGGIGGAAGQLLGGIQMLIEEGKQKKKTQQMLALSDVSAKAATSRPVGPQRKYVRPEDMLVQPGQIGSPYGSGLDFLQMEDGGPVVAQIGGNPTEIQNMYNPGDLYSDLGYEPLDESSKLKQFRKGGKAQFGMQTTGTTTTAFPFSSLGAGEIGNVLGSYIGGGGGQQSGAGQIGSAVGGIAGNLLLPGVGGAIGSALGGLVGGAIGGQSQKAMEQKQRKAQGNLASAALQQSLQGQFYGYMEHGGDLKYLSHTWQPQTITKFGDYTMKELLAPPKDADMLRAGGEIRDIRSNYMGDDEKLSMMQMGGELQTYWGGYAEPISQNPYLPDGGETVMFKGQSHEESDGRGRTGIGITYGDNPVEVERGEPAVKLRDGGTGDNSLVVFGNMKIPSYGVSELNDPKAKGKKFKTYAADLSKIENKANRTSDKATDILENIGGDGPFDLLSMSTANAMLKGSDMKLKDIAMKKQLAAGIQSAILDTAEEMGVESDALAKGKIKAMKGGGKLTSAQVGVNQPLTPIMPMSTYYQVPVRNTGFMPLSTTPEVEAMRKTQPVKPSSKVAKSAAKANAVKRDLAKLDYERDLSDPFPSGVLDKDLATTTPAIENLKKFKAIQPAQNKFNLMDFINTVSPYIRPLVQNPLDPSQLSPEMMALATNVPEPVQAQLFRPLLEEVPRVSLQDQLNEIQAEANAARRLVGNNPSAQAAIASQAAAAKNKVLGEQTRMNQMLQLESRRRNLATLNDATLKNLAIIDQQVVRQAQAQSATKAQAREALSSIADKIARNKAETLQANVMSNMYPQYRFGPKGRIYNVGLTDINIPQTVGVASPTAKNGSIVKAIKNL